MFPDGVIADYVPERFPDLLPMFPDRLVLSHQELLESRPIRTVLPTATLTYS